MVRCDMDYFDELTPQDIDAFILANEWKFAKTMASIPHAYCLKERCSDQETFEKFVMHIRRNGYEKNFFRKVFVYFDVGEHQYWTMGSPLEKTILINRAKL
jgi:hypothetical protein